MDWTEAKETILQNVIQKERIGLVTDVDGTISPIVDQPDAARVSPRTRSLLADLQRTLPLVAVISGRSAGDVSRRVGVEGLIYVGNHGMEEWEDGKAQVLPEIAKYRPRLEKALELIPALMVERMLLEDKGATLSLHYRQTKSPQDIYRQLAPQLKQIADSLGLRLTEGRMVFEVRPPLEIDKGTAFERLITTHQLDSALYLGDDTTDVVAFQMARRLRENGWCAAYSLGVKSKGTPQVVLKEADFLVQEVAGVVSFLDWFSKALMASST